MERGSGSSVLGMNLVAYHELRPYFYPARILYSIYVT